MDIKELLEKYLIDEVEVTNPTYSQSNFIPNAGELPKYEVNGFSPARIKQLNLGKLIALLSKIVKVEDIIDKK